MNLTIFLYILLISFFFICCKKECGVKNDKTAWKLMSGTWEVSEVITDSVTLTNTGEKFRFFDYERYVGDGIFTNADVIDESFKWSLKGNTFGFIDLDTSYVLFKRYHDLVSIKECSKKEFLFCSSYCNSTIKLKKE